jgi:hypothetical protein
MSRNQKRAEIAEAMRTKGKEKKEEKNKGGFMRKILGLLAVMLIGVVGAYGVTTDSVILTVTPLFNLSVNISSTSGTFGSLPLGSSRTICVGDVMNDGDVDAHWEKAATNTNNWTLLSNGTCGKDQFRLLVVTTAPLIAPTFAGTGIASQECIAGDHGGQMATGTAGVFSDLLEGGTATVTHTIGTTRSLWVSIMMPTQLSSSIQQTITLSIQAIP